jgi:hypothetical protein
MRTWGTICWSESTIDFLDFPSEAEIENFDCDYRSPWGVYLDAFIERWQLAITELHDRQNVTGAIWPEPTRNPWWEVDRGGEFLSPWLECSTNCQSLQLAFSLIHWFTLDECFRSPFAQSLSRLSRGSDDPAQKSWCRYRIVNRYGCRGLTFEHSSISSRRSISICCRDLNESFKHSQNHMTAGVHR